MGSNDETPSGAAGAHGDAGGASQGVLDYQMVERILALLGAGAGAAGAFEEKRRQIGAGLAAIVDADVWIWARSRMPVSSTDPVIFDTVDGGFVDDGERARFFAALYEPEVSDAYNRSLSLPLETPIPDPCARPTGAIGAGIRTRRVDDAMPDGTSVRDLWRRASGMDAGLVSMVPLGGPSWSGLGFHRRVGRPPFTDQDLCTVHLAVASVDRLHRDGVDVAANSDRLFAFRPRERQVLLYLLAGDQTKQIAAKLGISHHTVADYVKVIYRRLGVGTRTELLRLFLPGAPPAN